MVETLSSALSYRRVIAALAESEERYRVLVEGVTRYAIFMLNPSGIIVTWNRGILDLLGYDRDEIVGRSGSVVFNHTDRASGAFKTELATAKRKGESIFERSNLRKDGTEIRVHDTVTSIRTSAGLLLGFAKVTRRTDLPAGSSVDPDGTELANALASLQLEVEHRRRLEAQLLTAVEEERERLGRDLHDDLSQRLAAIALMIESLRKEIKRDSGANEKKASHIGRLLADTIAVARNLSRGLHPITLTTQGLPTALIELAERVPKEVKFHWPSSKKLSLDPSVALHLYRIAEEAVGNSLKHSEADEIDITLQLVPKRKVTLSIADNGKGLVRAARADGMGLQNMKYRAGVVGGTLRIDTALGRGTTVTCTAPLGPASLHVI